MAPLTAERILQPPPPTRDWPSLVPQGESAVDRPFAQWDVPLDEWDAAFNHWIAAGLEFREFEKKEFFGDVDSPMLNRIHRGWLCDLMSNGELLGVGLLKIVGDEEGKKLRLQQLDEFLLCLATTLDTWHAPDDRRQSPNPLDQFFK